MTEPIDAYFIQVVATLDPQCAEVVPGRATGAGSGPDASLYLRLFDAQLGSRHLDLAARRLQAEGKGYYTIGSSGHEGNVTVAHALRPTDPALLHYRSGAFYLERAAQVSGHEPLRDVLLGVLAATDEPISGGRHKVFGHRDLAVIPQTSTISSHLPRALGVAFAIERAQKLDLPSQWPRDAVAVCSFGDASANHSTAVGAINAAIYCTYQGLPLPLLLVCEDNGIGISVRTPPGWIHATYANRVGLPYFAADGSDLADALEVATQAADWVRTHRAPAFLHLRTVRLMGHAGSDVEAAYRSPAEINTDYRHDPLLGTARLLISRGILTAAEVLDRYAAKRAEVLAIAREVANLPQLRCASHVMDPIERLHPMVIAAEAARTAERPPHTHAGGAVTESGAPVTVTMAQAINRTLLDMAACHPEVLIFGEDVAGKGGVYGVTRGLAKKVGAARVFDTLLDEQSILGLALGTGLAGMLPIPEIQYLAYLHNAEDQLRGEAATLQFFSNDQYRNPMVVRVAGYAYQKGFGGHFHNDNAVGVLRDVPGLIIASPARPDDAAAMLRTCLAAANTDGRICVYLEPIALYHIRDLHTDGDAEWLTPYPCPADSETHVPVGRGRTYGDGNDLTMVTFGNGLRMSLRVARRLEQADLRCRVLDLRWLAPLPVRDLVREATATGRVLVIDETRRSGGVSEGVITALIDEGYSGALARVASEDSFIPLGEAARHVLVSETAIETAALNLVRHPIKPTPGRKQKT